MPFLSPPPGVGQRPHHRQLAASQIGGHGFRQTRRCPRAGFFTQSNNRTPCRWIPRNKSPKKSANSFIPSRRNWGCEGRINRRAKACLCRYKNQKISDEIIAVTLVSIYCFKIVNSWGLFPPPTPDLPSLFGRKKVSEESRPQNFPRMFASFRRSLIPLEKQRDSRQFGNPASAALRPSCLRTAPERCEHKRTRKI